MSFESINSIHSHVYYYYSSPVVLPQHLPAHKAHPFLMLATDFYIHRPLKCHHPVYHARFLSGSSHHQVVHIENSWINNSIHL